MRISGVGHALRALASRATGRGRADKARSSRGAAELSVVVVAASLVLGVVFGDGLSRTALDLGDGMSWLKDEPSGEVIQVNPATGRPEARIDVGAPGDSLDIAQYDGRLVVINRTTGELISFDLATLLASGQRSVTAGEATDVLLHEGKVFLVDREMGSISAIDPVTADVIGEVWVSDPGIVDAKIDRAGQVWAVDHEGLVSGLVWDEEATAFTTEDTREVKGSGRSSVLVAHDRGVTLFGPDEGIVVQVGTTADVTANAPRLRGEVAQPDQSPDDIVPVSAPETSTVVIVGRNQVREVNVASVGCPDPGRPEVYRKVVYVPCAEAGKVIRLAADGSSAGPDILLPEGGDVELVLDDGQLLINVQGADRGVRVLPDGSTQTFQRRDASIPVQQVRTAPPNRPDTVRPDLPNIPERVREDRDRGRDRTPPPRPDDGGNGGVQLPPVTPPGDNGDGDNGGGDGVDCTVDPTAPGCDDGGGGTTPDCAEDPTAEGCDTITPADPLTAPTAVTATLLADGRVRVTWTHGGPAATQFSVAMQGSTMVTTVGGDAREATMSGVPAGVASRFVVTALRPPETQASAPSNAVTPPVVTPLSAPTSVTASVQADGRVQVNWNHSGPAPEDFTIRISGGATLATVSAANRQAVVSGVPSGQPSRLVVTARRGSESQPSAPSNQVTPAARPGAPTNLSASASYGTSGTVETIRVHLNWGAAPDNGSAITRYDVTVSGPDGTRSFQAAADSFDATARFDCDRSTGCRLNGGTYTVSITATNAQGAGPAATTTATRAVPPPALPPAGRQLVTGHSHRWDSAPVEGFGTTTLTLAPPAEWASFSGTCSYTYSGARGGGQRAISCAATSLEVDVSNGYIWEPNSGTVGHSITFHASNGSSSVNSATYSWTTTQSTLCEGCQVP